MIRSLPIVAITLRNLLDRRRFWLMVLLAAVPVLLVLLARVIGELEFSERLFDQLIILIVLPLIALVFGTGALGSELDDGTIVYLLTKPARRVRIVLAKVIVAAGLTAALVVGSTVLTGIIVSTVDDSLLEPTLAYSVAAAVGAIAYAAGFLALSAFTSRALVIGLGYVLLWEGVVADLFPGAGAFSVRQATLGLADALQSTSAGVSDTDGASAVITLAVVIMGAVALGTWRMSRYQLRGGD